MAGLNTRLVVKIYQQMLWEVNVFSSPDWVGQRSNLDFDGKNGAISLKSGADRSADCFAGSAPINSWFSLNTVVFHEALNIL